MVKIVFAFLIFLRELFSERKEELQFTSVDFSIRRSLFFVLLIVVVLVNGLLINRLYVLMVRYQQLETRYLVLIQTWLPEVLLYEELAALEAAHLNTLPLPVEKKHP